MRPPPDLDQGRNSPRGHTHPGLRSAASPCGCPPARGLAPCPCSLRQPGESPPDCSSHRASAGACSATSGSPPSPRSEARLSSQVLPAKFPRGFGQHPWCVGSRLSSGTASVASRATKSAKAHEAAWTGRGGQGRTSPPGAGRRCRGWTALEADTRDAHRADLHQALAYAALDDVERVDSVLVYPALSPNDKGRPAIATLASGRRRVRLLLLGLPFGFHSPDHREKTLTEWRELFAA